LRICLWERLEGAFLLKNFFPLVIWVLVSNGWFKT